MSVIQYYLLDRFPIPYGKSIPSSSASHLVTFFPLRVQKQNFILVRKGERDLWYISKDNYRVERFSDETKSKARVLLPKVTISIL